MFKIAFIAAGTLLLASALLAEEKPLYNAKINGSVSTLDKPYYVRVTTNDGAAEWIQPPHTKFTFEAKSLYPTTSKRKLIRSFVGEGEVSLIMTQNGTRIMSMILMSGKAVVEVSDEPMTKQTALYEHLKRARAKELQRKAELERRSRLGLRVELHDKSYKGRSVGLIDPGLVHDYDLRLVVEALREANAQSISINSVPVTDSASIHAVGNYIHVGKQEVSHPYAVKALGNPEVLKKALSVRQGVLEKFRLAGPMIRFSPPQYVN